MYTAQLEACDRNHMHATINYMLGELANLAADLNLKSDKAAHERIARIVKQAQSLRATHKTIMGGI